MYIVELAGRDVTMRSGVGVGIRRRSLGEWLESARPGAARRPVYIHWRSQEYLPFGRNRQQ